MISMNSDNSLNQLIRNEIETLKACTKIKGIVKIIDVIVESTQIMVIMKYFEEKSLKEIIELGADLNFVDILTMIRDIADMVQSLNEIGITHQNLSLSCIRLKRKGSKIELLVSGFDYAIKSPNDGQDIMSSDLKLAPEIKAGEPYDKCADIWGLGTIAQELMTYSKDGIVDEISNKLNSLFKKMVRSNPLQRPMIDEVITALDNVL